MIIRCLFLQLILVCFITSIIYFNYCQQIFIKIKDMGNDIDICCNQKPPAQIQGQQLQLSYDETNNMFVTSYVTRMQAQNVFEKILYNWHSIPITTVITFQRPKRFSVRNNGIESDNFVVGIIKKGAIVNNISRPWLTNNVICFESHANLGENSIIYNGQRKRRVERGVKKNQIITVAVSSTSIVFFTDNQQLGFHTLPQGFRRQPILPYVALFNPNDKIQFISPIQIQTDPRFMF